MSRVGRNPVTLPEGVSATMEKNRVILKGPLGEMVVAIPFGILATVQGNIVTIARQSEAKTVKGLHGLIRQLIANAALGVSQGFKKELELQGMGFRVAKEGNDLSLSIGFSKAIKFPAPLGISFEVPEQTKITVKGVDKALVGNTSARIRALRPPEPYKGKGIRYVGEVVRHKAGKAGKVGTAVGGKA